MRLTGWIPVVQHPLVSSQYIARLGRPGVLQWAGIAAAVPTFPSRFIGAALFWAIAVPFLYEGYAILFRGDPTLSRIMAYQLTAHGWYIGIPAAFLMGGLFVLLLLHFIGFLPFWRVA